MSLAARRSFIPRALVLALRTLHITLPAAIIAVGSMIGIVNMLDGAAALGDLLLAASWLVGVAALLGWAVGAVCWRAVREVTLRGPTMRGRRRAAVLGILFAVASLLILPAPLILWSLWLAIPLAMIEGLPIPHALSEARRRAAATPLVDRALSIGGALIPAVLAAVPPFISSLYFTGEWSGLGVVIVGIMSALVALALSITWLMACCGALYADRSQQTPDLGELAEVFT